MSTRSLIAYYNEDTNEIHGTYCHSDGYPSWMVEALFDAVVCHGFDAICQNIEEAAKTGGIRSIPKKGAEWDCFNESNTDWLETFPGNTSDAKWRMLLEDSGYEHVYVVARVTQKFQSPQSASIFHVNLDETAVPNRNLICVPHIEHIDSGDERGQMSLSFA